LPVYLITKYFTRAGFSLGGGVG